MNVWSLGVILYFMVIGRCPFRANTSKQLKKQVVQAGYFAHVSEGAQSLIKQILTVDPMQRPRVEQIMGYPWLSQGGEYLPSHSSEPLPKHRDPAVVTVILIWL